MSLKNKIVIGGGVAGLIAAFYNDCSLIDKNIMGQLNSRFESGIRLFKYDPRVITFITKVLKCKFGEKIDQFEIKKRKIKVGYKFNDHISNEADEHFKKQYSLITRGTENYEPSFLSSGENEYDAIILNSLSPNETYKFVFETLVEYLIDIDHILPHSVALIRSDYRNELNTIVIDNGSLLFTEKIISTINLNILIKLVQYADYSTENVLSKVIANTLVTKTKSFFKVNINQRKYFIDDNYQYDYIYSIDGDYTRKTFFANYDVLESVNDKTHNNIAVEDSYINLPIQIVKSLKLQQYFYGIDLFGRFAEWDHSLKANELIYRYER